MLVKTSGISESSLRNYTKIDRDGSAKLDEVEKLARALGVSLAVLLTDHGDAEQIPLDLSEKERQLLMDLDDIPPPRKGAMLDMIHQAAHEAREAATYHEQKKQRRVAASESTRQPAHATVELHREPTPKQRELPWRKVDDPFNATPDFREAELYKRIEKTPKGKRK